MDSEKKLEKYGRTGWEFTAPGPIAVGFCSCGLSALVTIPVSTTLLFLKRRSNSLPLTDIAWTNDGNEDTRSSFSGRPSIM
jgi:hypothetical protein